MNKFKRILRFSLGIPVTVISFLFIAKILFDNKTTLISSFSKVNIPIFLLGLFFFVLFFALKSFVWLEIMKKRGHLLPKRRAIYYYSLAEVKRYIPGSVLAFLARMDSFSENVPQKETLKAIGIEALLLALSALVISFPAIYFTLLKTHFMQASLLLILILTFLTLITLFIFSKFHNRIFKYFDSFMMFLLAWFCYALASFLVAISFVYIYPTNILFILSFFVLSWLAGYILFIVPMGLGIRELVLTGSLSFFISAPIATAIALLTRVGMILGELLYLFVSYLFLKIKRSNIIFKINPAFVIVVIFALLYFIYFAVFTVRRHSLFLSGRFDLGNMSQTIWNTAHGNFFMLTNPDGTDQISRLAIHSDFILVFFAPFYYLWSNPKVLLIIQSLTLAFGGIIVYGISMHVLKKNKLSAVLAISFLLNFWIQEENIFDFHAVTLGTTLLLAAFYFMLKKRYFFFSVFLFLSVLTKENVFLVASIFGLYLFFKENKRIIGTLLTLIPMGIFYFLAAKAIPNARGGAHFALAYYSYLGDNTQEILKNIILKPNIILSHLFSLSTLTYFNELLISTGYLALLAPQYLVFTLPDLAINLLSNNQNLRSIQYHYGSIIIPFVYISSIFGIALILKKIKKPFMEHFIFYYILIMTLISVYFYSPLPGTKNADYGPYITPSTKEIRKYLSQIPKNESVTASNSIGAHLSSRKNIYVIPNAMKDADFIVLYNEKPKIKAMVNTEKYETLIDDSSQNFYIYKKKILTPCKSCIP